MFHWWCLFSILWCFIGYYTYVQQGSVPEHPEGVYDEIQNLDACLQLCYTSTSFVCNSFYYCPNELQCLFSKQHVPNTPAIKSADACQAYSSKLFNTNRQSLDCLIYWTIWEELGTIWGAFNMLWKHIHNSIH